MPKQSKARENERLLSPSTYLVNNNNIIRPVALVAPEHQEGSALITIHASPTKEWRKKVNKLKLRLDRGTRTSTAKTYCNATN
jgi:hypothetical protein